MFSIKRLAMTTMAVAACLAPQACSTRPTPMTHYERDELRAQAQGAVQRFERADPAMAERLESAYGYAVFPDVTKGGAGVGGAYGRGLVYEQGEIVGYAGVSQGTIGPQLGGQEYSLLVLFEDELALRRFKNGNVEFAAQASAIAARSASSTDADYEHGVMVFSMGTGGLMFEAAIGGQRFSYEPADRDPQAS